MAWAGPVVWAGPMVEVGLGQGELQPVEGAGPGAGAGSEMRHSQWRGLSCGMGGTSDERDQWRAMGVAEGRGLACSRVWDRAGKAWVPLTVWCKSGMPILKTIMLKWASSGTDMERPWRPRMEARLVGGAPL